MLFVLAGSVIRREPRALPIAESAERTFTATFPRSLLFGAWYAFNDQPQIVLDEAHVASIVATFQRTWLRLPTHEELASRVEDRIKEEILYWEALALGLDRSVTV